MPIVFWRDQNILAFPSPPRCFGEWFATIELPGFRVVGGTLIDGRILWTHYRHW